jgi:hypothetical protein
MTRLTITEDPGREFVLRGYNTSTDEDEDAIVFYEDVIGVHVAPEPDGFAIQVVTAESVIEMDFEDADKVREALVLFEAKKVLEVDFDVPNSVRIMPPRPEATAA